MAAGEGAISDSEKVRIASDFLLHAPPGEFNEVFNDVRMLLKNDTLLREGCAPVFAQYNREQFVPVKLEGVDKKTLVTPYNDIGGGRFVDDHSGKSFKFDHLRREAVDVADAPGIEAKLEPWRAALQTELDAYIDEHFSHGGIGCVFQSRGAGGGLVMCIESHQFAPTNYVNGRWRSEWHVPVGDGQSGVQDMKGQIKCQVHYYEDGNVQLFSDKPTTVKVNVSSDPSKTAKEVLRAISEEEAAYQTAIQENYTTMSESTFKALRRQLPVTRAKMDWLKVQSYRIGAEIKPQ
ncbi:cap-1 [Pristionchus pacificus]|uniref:F-actin-capping protein subunit alpha n=1 Tax=Pristionchus pacificus TaxID=54126 RepID=A0A454XQS7_PRIPA|nr:cap-1 [Pristionchus pacificus]|eukprot:PDM70003.1 cap-1 [Pristionchus pacificus]